MAHNNEFSDENIYYISQYIYEKHDLINRDDFENNTPKVKELLLEVIKLSDISISESDRILSMEDFELSRVILNIYSNTENGIEDIGYINKKEKHEVMSSIVDIGLLSILVVASLKNLVDIKVSNSGKNGKIKWSVNIGGSGNDAGFYKIASTAITQWLKNIAGESNT